MYSRGEYRDKDGTYGVIMSHTKQSTEIILVTSGQVSSAFKTENNEDYSFINTKAKEMYIVIKQGLSGCKAKNGQPVPSELGACILHQFQKAKVDYAVALYNNEIVGVDISGDNLKIITNYCADGQKLIPPNIPYTKLTKRVQKAATEDEAEENEEDLLNSVQVRTVQEIALEKEDISWLKKKNYYIVNDDKQAEKLFTFFDNYNGVIAYDTETTGLRINCFGKINSEYKKTLEKYNAEHPKDQIRADRLVGIIFCVEENTSYYFPCFNRKFKNLYDTDTPVRRKIIEDIKARYTVGEFGNRQSDMADYIRNTPSEQWGSDVILMERVRNILSTKHIVAHNGAFEWKVGWQYEIDTNLKDDTMILHQIMYKFRSTTSNRGEPSNLKYLAKRELGIDQWELDDFFPEFKEQVGEVRSRAGAKKKKSAMSRIDFSYMDYDGTRVYAPTDGDVTLGLFLMYKRDMMQNHKNQEYIYNVEVIVACAIAYMEFYGHRIDEEKIAAVRDQTKAKIACIESEIRQLVNYASESELTAYNNLKAAMKSFEEADKHGTFEEREKTNALTLEAVEVLKNAIAANTEHELNLASPSQVAELFYDVLEIPFSGEKKSVAKKEIKGLMKMKDEEGNPKYPVVHMYSEYKKLDTLMTKFFDCLWTYQYPGGLIFSSFGQISTATGRMSCSKPNAQQYPKAVTSIVVPRPGYVMMDADYSQIEYRVLTALAGNDGLAKLFSDPDSDYHTLMASMMYGVDYASVTPKMRGDAKSFNFGIPYGMGLGSLAILLTGMNNATTRSEAAEKYEKYFENQPKTRKFFDQVKEMAQVNKYTKTFWSRYRYYSFTDADGNENSAKKAAALRQAGNAVIQGCLHGDTRIQTKEFGIVRIKDYAGYNRVHVWDGEKWVLGDITYSGKKQKCIVTFSNGQRFICSPIHKFLVKSSKGNERFVECQDLIGKNTGKNPHRVVINKEYAHSDHEYSSSWAYKYLSTSHNANNALIENIGDSFRAGVMLGRLASDGSIIKRDNGASYILHYIAEHESEVGATLLDYMKSLGAKYKDNELREDRNEKVDRIYVYSSSLTNEVDELDIKHKVHDNIFMDTEMLRGFLRGFFDGDGGVSGKTITLVFGTQYDFEPMCRDIQKALLFFGIRSRYRKYSYRHVLSIKTNDNQKFLDLIGFVNEDKQCTGRKLSTIRDEHIFGPTLVVESVEITDEYIDMYDVCNTDDGYYVADGIITHNTAADIFKISVARNFMYIRENNLFGDLLIVNMIHDEQLFEVNASKLNMQRVLRDVGINMQFKVEGFPPLYIGAGIGPAWAKAKGKMAEIHPMLLEQLSREADTIPLKHPDGEGPTPKEILDYFANRVLEFRKQKIRSYVTDPDNFGKDLHPAIGNLLNLQFTYGHDKDKEGYSDTEFTQLCLEEFIKNEGLTDIDPNSFKTNIEQVEDVEEDKEYSDGDEDDPNDLDDGSVTTSFALIDEKDVVYGATIHEIIKQFNLFVSVRQRVCGVNLNAFNYKQKEEIVEFLSEHTCTEDAPGSMEVVFLQEANILNRTGIYVNNIDGSALEARMRAMGVAI